jgi:hypothetical protein
MFLPTEWLVENNIVVTIETLEYMTMDSISIANIGIAGIVS